MKNQVGRPLTLVGKTSEGSSQKEKAVKKKKALVAESDDEEGNSEGEDDLNIMMKTLALITRDYNRRFRRPSYRGPYEREEKDDRRDEKRSHQRSDGRGGETSESKGDKSKGFFKFGKPGHYVSEFYSKDSRPMPQKMQFTTKRKVSTILRGLCLLKRRTSKLTSPLLMKQTTHRSVG